MIGPRLIIGLLLLGVAGHPAAAHPPAIVTEAAEKAVGEEVKSFRKAMADAITAKDAVKLRQMYATSFLHTHTTGKTDNRDARIVSALAGDPVIETAPVEDLVVRVPNDWVAVATGISLITSKNDATTQRVRWTAVYTRHQSGWQLVASQATRILDAKP